MKVYVLKYYDDSLESINEKIFSFPPKNKDVIDTIMKITGILQTGWIRYNHRVGDNRAEDDIFQDWNFNEFYFSVEEHEVIGPQCKKTIHEKPLTDMKPGDSYQVKNDSDEILYTFGRAEGVNEDGEEK